MPFESQAILVRGKRPLKASTARFSSETEAPIVLTHHDLAMTVPPRILTPREEFLQCTAVRLPPFGNEGLLGDSLVLSLTPALALLLTAALQKAVHDQQLRTLVTKLREVEPEAGDGRVRGIPNYGNSCFLNVALQSLATLEPFQVYLQQCLELMDSYSDSTVVIESACRELESLLGQLNGRKAAPRRHVDPRLLLWQVSQKHTQFQSKLGGSLGTDQHDAQELLHALVGIVVDEAGIERLSIGAPFADDHTEPEQLTAVMAAKSPQLELSLLQKDTATNGSDSVSTTLQHHKSDDLLPESSDEHRREEKKQDEGDLTMFMKKEEVSLPLISLPGLSEPDSSMPSKQPARTTSRAVELMLTSTSSTTPSPLCGWIGSTLECRTCRHIRPIQSTPFFDIAVVPTAVSRILAGDRDAATTAPPCLLEDCLEEYTSVERVHDVECCACTLRAETENLREDVDMMKAAVDSISSRSDQCQDTAAPLRQELRKKQEQLSRLVQTSVDEEAIRELLRDAEDPFGSSPALQMKRSDAFKCLLFTRLPAILCIHVQRRYYANGCMSKTLQHVRFPEILDVAPYCAFNKSHDSFGGTASRVRRAPSEPIHYRLQSVVEHRGSAFGGHYVCFRRDTTTDDWVFVSDDYVKPVEWSDVRIAQAYMLFYGAI